MRRVFLVFLILCLAAGCSDPAATLQPTEVIAVAVSTPSPVPTATITASPTQASESTTPPPAFAVGEGGQVMQYKDGQYAPLLFDGQEIAATEVITHENGWVTTVKGDLKEWVIITDESGETQKVAVSYDTEYVKQEDGQETLTPKPNTAHLIRDYTEYYDFKDGEWVPQTFPAKQFPFDADTLNAWLEKAPVEISFLDQALTLSDAAFPNFEQVWQNPDKSITVGLSEYGRGLYYISQDASGKLTVATDTRFPELVDVSQVMESKIDVLIRDVKNIMKKYGVPEYDRLQRLTVFMGAIANPQHPRDWVLNPTGVRPIVRTRTDEAKAQISFASINLGFKNIQQPDKNEMGTIGWWNTTVGFLSMDTAFYGDITLLEKNLNNAIDIGMRYGGYAYPYPELEKALNLAVNNLEIEAIGNP